MSYHGTKAIQTIRNEQSFVHGQGWTHTLEYHGGDQEINGLIPSLIDAGYEFRTSKDGPYLRLVATRAGTEADAERDYLDKYSITKETLQKSIWTHPLVVAEMKTLADNTGVALQDYRIEIENAVEQGDESLMENAFGSEATTSYRTAWGVFYELCRGADSYETEYIVLTRERVVSIEYAETDTMPIPQLNAARIYPTSISLQAAFGIPDLPGVTWPDATPLTNSATDLQWGWRERKREIRWQEGARIEVVQDWTFAEWSTNLYTVVTP